MPQFHSIKLCVLWMTRAAIFAQFNQWDPSMGGVGPVEEYFIQRTLTSKIAWERRQSPIHVDGAKKQTILLSIEPGVDYAFRIRPSVKHQLLGLPGPEVPIKSRAGRST